MAADSLVIWLKQSPLGFVVISYTGVVASFILFGLYQGLGSVNDCYHTFFMPDIKKIHIGELIDAKLRDKKMSYAEFARLINVDRTTVYNIVRSKSIDIDRLLLISKVLNYNFIEEVYLERQVNQKVIEFVVPESELLDIDKITSIKIVIETNRDSDTDGGE